MVQGFNISVFLWLWLIIMIPVAVVVFLVWYFKQQNDYKKQILNKLDSLILLIQTRDSTDK